MVECGFGKVFSGLNRCIDDGFLSFSLEVFEALVVILVEIV